MSTVFAALPLWVWLLAAAALGAVTVWVYWRCLLADRLAIVETELAARDLALSDAKAELDRFAAGGVPTPAPMDEDAVSETPAPLAERPAASGAIDAGELETLRYRAWALETRLRSALDQARAGEAIDAAALSRDLETLTDDGAPLEAISALKYRNWLLETRLARMSDAVVEPDDAPAPEAEALTPADADVLARQRDRLSRILTAAKLGNLSDIAEIEREIETDPAALGPVRLTPDLAAPLGMDLEGDSSVDALRYRNWLLAGTLKRVVDRLNAGERVDGEQLETLLREETRGRWRARVVDTSVEEDLGDLHSADSTIEALRRERDRYAEEASGLRYRRWLLSRRLGDVVSGLRDGAAVNPDGLEHALMREGETPLDNPDAPRPSFLGPRREFQAPVAALATPVEADPAAREEAESLRYRLWLVQGELRRLRLREDAEPKPAAAPAPQFALQASAAAEQARYWSAEWRAQMMRQRAEDIEARRDERDRAAADLAASLRGRLAQAEAALRGLRAAAATASSRSEAEQAAEIEAAEARASALLATERERWTVEQKEAGDALRVALSESREEAAALRRRLWDIEWSSKERDGAEATLRSEAEAARSRLSDAEARERALSDRLAQAEAALETARAEAREARDATVHAVPVPADPDPMLLAEVETLRARLRNLEQAESDVATMRRSRDEAETLRSRLALSEAENERMRGQLADALRARSMGAAGTALAAARESASAFAGDVAPERRPEPAWAAERRAPAPAEGGSPLRSLLAPAIASPIGGAEAAADEMIQRGEVIAMESNRPLGLLSAPRGDDPDDLSLIQGVNPRLATELNRVGLYHFFQLAEFGPRDLAWIDDRMGLGGAVIRDRWLPQARLLSDLRSSGRLRRGEGGRFALHDAPEPRYEPAPRSHDYRAAEPAPAPRLDPRPAPSPAPSPAPMPRPAAGTSQVDPSEQERLRRAAVEEVESGWTSHALAIDISEPIWGVEMATRDLLEDPLFVADAGKRPSFAPAPTGPADDLTMLRGVGPRLAELLAQFGLTRFEQISDLTPEAAAWLDRRVGLGGRVVTERWIPQAYRQIERRERRARTAAAERAEAAQTEMVKTSAPAGDVDDAADIEREAERLIRAGLAGAAPTWLLQEGDDDSARDDLTEIESIGPKLEARMNELGLRRYDQLARFTASDLAWLDSTLRLGGRTVRESWLPQARRRSRGWRRRDRGEGEERREAAKPAPAQAQAVESEWTADELEALELLNSDYEADPDHRPAALMLAPTRGQPDDLKEIWGIGVKFEEMLNELGVYYFEQLAELSAKDLAWIDAHLRFRGRAVRDRWIPQARAIVAERRRARDGGEG